MLLHCNAKINLFLRVVGRRDDGFHEIESVFHSVTLSDEIEIEPVAPVGSGPAEIALEVSARPELDGLDNTMTRAAVALRQRTGTGWGASIRALKRIPVGAGLGGGSADAAAVILGLDRSWGTDLPADELAQIAEEIGSDVPYCLRGGAMLVTGRGEVLSPIPAPAALSLVLGISHEPLSTPEIYRRWDEIGTSSRASAAPLAAALGAGNMHALAESLHNDLEVVALDIRPVLAEKKAALLEAGALGAVMSGSGPTMLGLCEDDSSAGVVAERVGEVFDEVVVVRTVDRCVLFPDRGPAPVT